MPQTAALHINLRETLRAKLGAKARLIPGFVVKWLEKTIRQEQLNDILEKNHPKRGAEFCAGVLDYLDVSLEAVNPQAFPPKNDNRVIFVCNHPLGGLDGIALIKLFDDLYGPGTRFVVNDILMAVEPLREVFLPINKHGRQDRAAAADINRVMEGDMPVLVFPAGLVSRMDKKGAIHDLDWHKMFVNKALQYHRDVVPLFFSGHNSRDFYKFARRRVKTGLKLNIEMIYLPREMLDAAHSTFTVTVGERIPWNSLAGTDPVAKAAEIKETVYNLHHEPENNRPR